jgi:large subunit ribosomal protein L15
MQIHELQPKKKKSRKRVGRGGKRGTYCGRGVKGQLSRSGTGKSKVAGGQTSIFKRTPKLGGFTSVTKTTQAVTIKQINKTFKDGDVVTPKLLFAKGLVGKFFKKAGVKIIGNDKLVKKVVFKGLLMSEGVSKMISSKKVVEKVESKK